MWRAAERARRLLIPVICDLVLGRPGGDLLSHVLRRSTIGAEGFHGRVRDGIGCRPLAMTTRSAGRTFAWVFRGCDALLQRSRGAAGLPLRVALGRGLPDQGSGGDQVDRAISTG